MSKTVNNLRKIEARMYRDWCATVRYVAECRNAFVTAEPRDEPEKKANLVMATANADRAFNTWLQICDALDEIEAEHNRRGDDG